MEIERDKSGRTVAVVSVEAATDAVSWRIGDANAVRAIAALLDRICVEAGENGQPCPDAVLIDFGQFFQSRWV